VELRACAGCIVPAHGLDVEVSRLKAAVLEGYNTRYGEMISEFQSLVR